MSHKQLIRQLRNAATYLKFATRMPPEVASLIYTAADEIEDFDRQQAIKLDPVTQAEIQAIIKRNSSRPLQ